ncbi:sugar-binding transcriptional regulator [Oceaniglobus indicus]|uniref:sugar-binding transcriptional regulator n=1 Tax=Oceaniglobus indicus TaxID=2047749 RepID=UPI000C1789D8|nr:sugar-binding transcriptional regulator [Oceaniglobus indicus]
MERRSRARIEGQITEAAWLYYHDDLNQNDIARRLGVSRATVANYLSEARRKGHVRVSLTPEAFGTHSLARDLVAHFGLTGALVVPPGAGDRADALRRTARACADWLPDLMAPGDRLGVSWGETVFLVSEAAERMSLPDLTIVQMVGSRATPLGFAAETCSANLARRFGAGCVNLHAPLIVGDADLAARLRAEPVIAEQLAAIATCNKTLFAAGSCTLNSHIVKNGVVTPDLLADYVARGAQAVLCGRFIDGDGIPIPGEMDDRMIGVELPTMPGKDMGLLVSSGPDKVAPIRAAIRGGFATHLVTCWATAEALLGAPA